MVALCLIYELEKLTDQRFQQKFLLSPPSGNSELKLPHAFGIAKCVTTHAFRIQAQETPLSLGILRCCPLCGYGYFLESPNLVNQ